jgi:chromosome segregation ATPase
LAEIAEKLQVAEQDRDVMIAKHIRHESATHTNRNELVGEMEDLQERVQTMRRQIDSLASEKYELTQKLDAAESMRRTLQDKIASFDAELAKTREENKKTVGSREGMVKLLDEMKQTHAMRLELAQKDCDTKIQQALQVQQELEQKLSAARLNHEREVENMRHAHEEESARHAAKIKELQDRLDHVVEEESRASKRRKSIELHRENETKAQLLKMEQARLQAETQGQEANRQRDNAQRDLQSARQECDNLTKALAKMQGERDTVQRKVDEQFAANADLKTKYAALERDLVRTFFNHIFLMAGIGE